VRLSGPRSRAIAEAVCGRALQARHAHHARFTDATGDVIDDGIALRFDAPRSYTGEDVTELQAHGSRVLLQRLVERCCELGARPARPGEFSERAFRNGRLDLAQAEAVADLIAASDLAAARAARRSLDGAFSQQVDALADGLLALRVHVEAAIDFSDEPIEALGLDKASARLERLAGELDAVFAAAERGQRLRDGLHAVIVGPPNAGKSSLLNALAGSERAIVTDIAGTTRDLLAESIRSDGVELTLVDTAGLREGGDAIEREGMRRARRTRSRRCRHHRRGRARPGRRPRRAGRRGGRRAMPPVVAQQVRLAARRCHAAAGSGKRSGAAGVGAHRCGPGRPPRLAARSRGRSGGRRGRHRRIQRPRPPGRRPAAGGCRTRRRTPGAGRGQPRSRRRGPACRP
jgi:hypothetical protein